MALVAPPLPPSAATSAASSSSSSSSSRTHSQNVQGGAGQLYQLFTTHYAKQRLLLQRVQNLKNEFARTNTSESPFSKPHAFEHSDANAARKVVFQTREGAWQEQAGDLELLVGSASDEASEAGAGERLARKRVERRQATPGISRRASSLKWYVLLEKQRPAAWDQKTFGIEKYPVYMFEKTGNGSISMPSGFFSMPSSDSYILALVNAGDKGVAIAEVRAQLKKVVQLEFSGSTEIEARAGELVYTALSFDTAGRPDAPSGYFVADSIGFLVFLQVSKPVNVGAEVSVWINSKVQATEAAFNKFVSGRDADVFARKSSRFTCFTSSKVLDLVVQKYLI